MAATPGRRGNDHPLGAFFLDLVQERGLACAGLACEKNILACIAHVFECEVELRIGNEAHVLKFATHGLALTVFRPAAKSMNAIIREPSSVIGGQRRKCGHLAFGRFLGIGK